MNARISRSAKAGRGSSNNHDEPTGFESDLVFDDLLDARFDEQGRLSQVGRGSQQRIAERLEPRPPVTSAEDLEQAVQKLAAGLEAIERQSHGARRTEATGGGRDFVTYSLDRLEARLEALSERLQSRAARAGIDRETEVESAPPPRGDPSLAVEPDYAAESAELRRLAEAEAERVQRQAQAAAERAREEAEIEARRRAEYEAAKIRRRVDEEAAEARRREEEDAEEARSEAAEALRRAEEEAAEAVRRAEEEAADARRRAEEAEAEARRQAEAAEAERQARLAEARREAEAAAETQRQFAEIEARIDALQRSCDANQIEPVRDELIGLLHEIEELSRDRGSIAAALKEIGARLGEMEVKVNAARNMAGNRLGDIQDRLAGLTERLDEVQVEIPGFDAVRENQGAILERFDRMEGLVHRLASPEELLNRVDGLRRQLDTVAPRQDVAKIEEQILGLAERLDALPEDMSDAAALEKIEERLATLASELTEARQLRMSAASDLDRRLSDLSDLLREVGESGRNPDLSGLEERIAELGARFDEDREQNGEVLSNLERRLAELAAAIDEQEDGAEILTGLTRKIDALAETVEAQDMRGARGDIELLDGKLDQLAEQLAEQAEHLSRAQVQPLEERLDRTQQQLEELARHARASSDQLRPFAQKLQEISDRVSALGGSDERTPLSLRLGAIEERLAGLTNSRGPDPRALQTQLEGIVSRLELLKGRSIDPAHLTDLFDRVDAAIRAMPEEGRFDRLEQKLAAAVMATERAGRQELGAGGGIEAIEEQIERLERLERLIGESAAGGISEEHINRLEQRIADTAREALGARDAPDISEERFARLERTLEQIGVAYSADGELLSPEDLAELRGDIVALRRELRSLPGLGEGEGNLSEVLEGIARHMERLPENPPATAAELEAQVERIAELLDDPGNARLALAHIETSLKTIEERLEETRRSLAYRPPLSGEAVDMDVEAVAGMARALSDDVSVLKGSSEASEKKTKEALDAVQDTLEAVVKRMAFLEHDAETTAQQERPSVDAEATAEPEGHDDTVELAERFAPVRPAEPDIAEAEAELAAESAPSEPRTGGGLLSRFTSRQLLKRATGGRAESFTPEPEESDDASDFPLEPGTDSPLSSALAGAPSSDTEFMSGARSRASMGSLLDAEDSGAASSEPAALGSGVDEDFLTAARRAARAAAAEVVDDDGTVESSSGRGRIAGVVRERRGALIAAAFAVAVAFAALQIIRGQMNPGGGEIAAVPEAAQPIAPAADAGPTIVTKPQITQAETVTPEIQSSTGGADNAASAVTQDAKETGAETSSSVASEPLADTPTPSAETAQATPTREQTAALAPAPGDAPMAAPPPEGALPEGLPITIGSQLLRDAALAGDPAAAFEVAARYAEGRGGLQDMRTAVEWYERAAEAGLAPAQYRLGSIYEKGIGVPKDIDKAQEWYSTAAAAGNVKAMHNLAVLHAEGAGGEPDLERAAALFRQAAEHGVRDSQFNLAILHARGLGVPQDLIEAYKWFSIAATSGDEESAKRRDIIAAALPEDDLAKAQVAAASFEPVPLISEANEVKMPDGGWNDPQDSTSVEVQPVAEDAQVGSVLSENDLVALVQKLLTDKGFNPGPADGLFGRQTMQAILKFQGQAGLPRTGQIDPGLVEALKGASG
jgi:localization factor PodJL